MALAMGSDEPASSATPIHRPARRRGWVPLGAPRFGGV